MRLGSAGNRCYSRTLRRLNLLIGIAGISQRVQAIIHPREWVGVRHRLCVQTTVVDTEAERPILLGHKHHRACSFASCGFDNPSLKHLRDIFGLHVSATMALAIRRLMYGFRTRCKFDPVFRCRDFTTCPNAPIAWTGSSHLGFRRLCATDLQSHSSR